MFLESPRFPTNVSFQRPGGGLFNTDVQVLENRFEQRNSFWDEHRRELQIGYGVRSLEEALDVDTIFHAMKGMFHGFRIRDHRGYKSIPLTVAGPDANDSIDDPISATDQVISIDASTQDAFQLIYTYRFGFLSERKYITKPTGVPASATGSVLLAIQDIVIPPTRYDLLSVPTEKAVEGHETVGLVTLAANIQKNIAGITNAASAVVETTVAHTLSVNDSVHFSSVGGMTQINGRRGLITGVGDTTHFTVAIDSSAFGVYTAGGQINTRRQSLAFNLTITAISKHAFAKVTTSGAHNLRAGDVGVITGVVGMTEMNNRTVAVAEVIDSTHFRIDVNSVEFASYVSGGTMAVAERVTAGYIYDLAARFNSDYIPLTFEAWHAAGTDLQVVEIPVI